MARTSRLSARSLLATAACAALAAGALTAPAVAEPSRSTFVVVVDNGQGDPETVGRDLARRHGGSLGFVYRDALKGFSISVPEQAADSIARDRRVASIERDQVFTTTAQETPTGVRRTFAAGNASLGIDGHDDARVDVDIAIIDTGLDSDHPDLNIAGGVDCASGSWRSNSCVGGVFEDGNGHGTHVGGTAAALDNDFGVVGMAPGARLHGVRVLNNQGSGYTSWIIAGIDWVTANAGTIEVANMSLGCECSSTAQDQAISSAVAAGVTMVVAAGNSDKNASTFNPANHKDVITVSALADFNGLPGGGAASTCRADVDDTLADFSNWGLLVEIAAPGVCIRSTWLNNGYNTISGTSMASPHVAGAAALLASTRSTANKEDTVAIKNALVAAGNLGWTDDSGDGVKEPLLDVSSTTFAPTMITSDGGSGTNTPPTARFTPSCTDLSCSFDGTASSDSDGTISGYAWTFGDGSTGSGATTSHGYAAGGTYTVTLTVTDNAGATGWSSQSVSVTAPATGGITLSASGRKVKGVQHVDLTWSGATSTNVDVFRNGAVVTTTTANPGSYTDNIGVKGGGSYTYKICEADDAPICSAPVTVTF